MAALKEIHRKENAFEFVWSDDEHDQISFAWLRTKCMCALCLEEPFDLSQVNPKLVQRICKPKKVELVGNYAMGVEWADGHRSILAFDRIRQEYRSQGLPKHLKGLQA